MKRFNILFILATTACISFTARGQVGVLYPGAAQCLFIESREDLSVCCLKYSSIGDRRHGIQEIKGFPLMVNLEKNPIGKYYLIKLRISKNNLIGGESHDNRAMIVRLFFDKRDLFFNKKPLPDTVNYYLKISEFKEQQVDVFVARKKDLIIKMELKGKGEPFYDGDHQLIWPKSTVFDITKLAFPNRK